MKFSDERLNIVKALFGAQSEFKPLKKDAYNPRFKSNYTSLESIWDSIKEPLINNDILVVQDVTGGEKFIEVVTLFIHNKSGEWLECGPLRIFTKDIDAQASGSAITYAKKYSLCAALGLVTGDGDDDGNQATTQREAPKPPVDKNISKEQVEEIELLLDDNYDLRSRVLSKMAISSFSDLKCSQYLGVIKGIRASLKEQDENN